MLIKRLVMYFDGWILALYSSDRAFARLSSSVPSERYVATEVSHRKRAAASPAGAGLPAGAFVSIRETSSRTVRTEQRWARGYSTASVENSVTAPRVLVYFTLFLDCSSVLVLVFSLHCCAAGRSPGRNDQISWQGSPESGSWWPVCTYSNKS